MEPHGGKEWMLAIARGDYHTISRLLREEPRLARRRVSPSSSFFLYLKRATTKKKKEKERCGQNYRPVFLFRVVALVPCRQRQWKRFFWHFDWNHPSSSSLYKTGQRKCGSTRSHLFLLFHESLFICSASWLLLSRL